MTLFAVAANKLSRHLGYGMPATSILSSISFVACLFFYLYVIGSFFKITIHPLIDRVTFYVFFEEHLISEYLDSIIAIVAATLWLLFSINSRSIRYSFSITYGGIGIIILVISPNDILFDIITLLSLPLIISVGLCYLYCYYTQHRNNLNFNGKLALRYICLALIAISVMSITISILAAFLLPDFDIIARDSYANEIFLLLSSFSSIYIALLVFCLPVKVLLKELLRIFKLNIKEDMSQVLYENYGQNKLRTQTRIVLLVLTMILSVVLVLIPQNPSINKDNQDIGVDTHYYVTWIGELAKSKSISDLIYEAFIVQGHDGDRPFSLIFLFLVYQAAGGNLSEVIEHSPIILGPGTVLAFYFLTLELARNEKIALTAAFLGAVSIHTLIGIYAGFYANWLALIVGYISIVFLFRYLKSGHSNNIVAFLALTIATMFFHVYTWAVLSAVEGIFLIAILFIQSKKNSNIHFNSKKIIWLLLVIMLSVVIDIGRAVLTGSSGGIEQDIEIAQRSISLEQFNLRWQILTVTMYESFGGVFSNFIILILVLLWVLKSNLGEPINVFLMIFLSTGLVPLFFGSWAVQARVLYDMPFEIPAAIALYYVLRMSDSMVSLFACCTWLIAVSLLAVMNYYLILVPGAE